jgi:putative hemolysin
VPDELGDTLAGFIYGQLGKVPDEGDQFETERLQIEVLSVVDRRIRKVRVKRLAPDGTGLTEEEHDKENHSSNGNGHSTGH